MFGIFGSRPRRFLAVSLSFVLLAIGILLLVVYYGSIHATLRITTGPESSLARRFIAAFVATTQAAHPRVDFKTVSVPDLSASAKALEDGKVDLALIRTDVSPPSNGETLVILRRDVVAIILPPKSQIDKIDKLAGKTIAIPAGPVQNEDSRALDLILSYYDVRAETVKREFLPIGEIGAALARGRAAAAVAVGPIGPGPAVDTVASIAKATRGTPTILEIDENDAISARFPGLESIDIPQGTFRSRPAVPDDDIKGVAVSYRFVVPVTMLNIVAGALGRSILNTKSRLMQLTPLAAQIEAPDTSQTNTILPIHPGFANYLNSGDQSFFDEFQTYLYAIGIPVSLLGSLLALLTSMIGNRKTEQRQQKLFRLLLIADDAATANRERLSQLEAEYRSIVSVCVSDMLGGGLPTEQGPVSLAVDHARRALELRNRTLASSASHPQEATSAYA